MSVPYYLGAQAIAERLGYSPKNSRIVKRLAVQDGLPIYKRRKKTKNKGFVTAFCISESALTAWELAKGRETVQRLIAEQELKQLNKRNAL
jgi:hypothetical protein